MRSGKWKLRAKNLLKNENIYNEQWRDTDVGNGPVPPALYDLSRDPAEQKSRAARIIRGSSKRLRGYLEAARGDLGDSLTGVGADERRAVGRVENPSGQTVIVLTSRGRRFRRPRRQLLGSVIARLADGLALRRRGRFRLPEPRPSS